MAPSLLGIPERVATVVQPLGVQRGTRPFRTLGRSRRVDGPLPRTGTFHGEADLTPIGGPAKIGRRLRSPRQLSGRSRHCQMQHEDLRALGLALGQVRDALAVRRPDRIAALGEEAVMLAVGAHYPYRSLKIVGLFVDHR